MKLVAGQTVDVRTVCATKVYHHIVSLYLLYIISRRRGVDQGYILQ